MKTCKFGKNTVNRYVLGLLNSDEKTDFLEHLDSCDVCKTYLETITQAQHRMKKIEPKKVETPYYDVSTELNKNKRWMYSIAASLILVAVSSVVYYFMNETKSQHLQTETQIFNNQRIYNDTIPNEKKDSIELSQNE